MPVFLLKEDLVFPPPHLASESGLLAVGGDLSPERLLLAYGQGIFPWYSDGEPILWWCPDPRLVLHPEQIRISRSLKRTLNKTLFRVTMDRAFEQVIKACARLRLESGESMFTRRSNASKVALVYLARQLSAWSFNVIDCQVTTGHLQRFNAREVPRSTFLELLYESLKMPTRRGSWKLELDDWSPG